MKKDIFIYPAILTYYNTDNIGIEFPDLPGCVSNACITGEAIHNAKEVLSLHLYGMEEDGFKIPEPSSIDNIELEPNQQVILIKIE